IGVLGARGRMGQWVTRLVAQEFSAQAEISAQVGRGDSLDPLLDADAVIDFSLPQSMITLARAALARPEGPLPAFAVGSTGWPVDDRRVLEELAKRTPVLLGSNFSMGVLALIEILKGASPLFEKLGYTPVIVETHHRHKKDTPSGTALSLQRTVSPAGPG